MSIIVTDTGFAADDWTAEFTALTDMAANDCGAVAIDLASDAEPDDLAPCLDRIAMIPNGWPAQIGVPMIIRPACAANPFY